VVDWVDWVSGFLSESGLTNLGSDNLINLST